MSLDPDVHKDVKANMNGKHRKVVAALLCKLHAHDHVKLGFIRNDGI